MQREASSVTCCKAVGKGETMLCLGDVLGAAVGVSLDRACSAAGWQATKVGALHCHSPSALAQLQVREHPQQHPCRPAHT